MRTYNLIRGTSYTEYYSLAFRASADNTPQVLSTWSSDTSTRVGREVTCYTTPHQAASLASICASTLTKQQATIITIVAVKFYLITQLSAFLKNGQEKTNCKSSLATQEDEAGPADRNTMSSNTRYRCNSFLFFFAISINSATSPKTQETR